jgi:hypothetical protein
MTTSQAVEIPAGTFQHGGGVDRTGERAPLRVDVEEYYRTIAPYYDAEVAERGDEAGWRQIGRSLVGQRVLDLELGGAVVAEATFEARAWDIAEIGARLARHGLAVETRAPIVIARRAAV